MDSETVHTRISQGTHVLWEGEATSISSVNSDGPFDVLAQHANLITLIKDVPLIITLPNGNSTTYTFKQAVLYVTENRANIYGDFTDNIV